jgi:hypothetical protein
MLRRILVLSAVLTLLLAYAAAPLRADDGGPDDPCKTHTYTGKGKGKHKGLPRENPCSNIPEVPVSLLYPLTAGLLVAIVLYRGNRRRSASPAVR